MKKQASPVPTPRAAALSQSASQYAAGAASAWQNIAGNSSRLADANRRANGPGYAPLAPGQAAPPEAPNRRLTAPSRTTRAPGQRPEPQETIRQVGWREVDRAVGMSTKRKYNLFGIRFGPKVPVFETEKVKLPVYQETDRNKRYYAAVKMGDVSRIKREIFQAETDNKDDISKTIKQFNRQDTISFFNSEVSARNYSQTNIEGDYAIVEFVMPEYQEFTFDPEARSDSAKSSQSQTMWMAQNISAEYVKNTKEYSRIKRSDQGSYK